MSALYVIGMHGLGDNLHQRAIVRSWMQEHEVWLETPWPSVYHDLPGLNLVNKGSRLRTQAKNARREAARFSTKGVQTGAKRIAISYAPELVRQHGSVLAAMAAHCDVPVGDFSLPVPDAWKRAADAVIAKTDKPLMIYRPLVERKEWGGCRNRNPEYSAYAFLFEAIRDRFHVVSVADLEAGKEWMVGDCIEADQEFHAGELSFEILAALMHRAALSYSAPGFATVLAQAVGTPSITVFGGYENSQSFAMGAMLAPTLGIDPINPCQCFSHHHACQKKIDVAKAEQQIKEFIDATQPKIHQSVAA